jgi:DNA modification methylase
MVLGDTSLARSLAEIEDEIRAHHSAAEAALGDALQHAWHVGRLLLEAKPILYAEDPSGRAFGAWAEGTCGYTQRHRSRLMRLASAYSDPGPACLGSSLRSALAALGSAAAPGILVEDTYDRAAAPAIASQAQGPSRVQVGEIWALGAHRLACGDSGDPEHVRRLMGGRRAELCFTDPPYNLGPKLYAQNAVGMRHTYGALAAAPWNTDFDLRPALDALLPVMAVGCTVYVCTSQLLVQVIWDWAKGWCDYSHYCVWCKPNPTPSLARRHWAWGTELIVYAVRGEHICNYPAEGNALNWWQIPARAHETNHPAEKPLAVPAKAIEFSSTPGQAVVDVFGGSGSTLLAAEQLGRHAYLSEIDPRWCDVTIARWEKLTGETARRVSEVQPAEAAVGVAP